MTTINFEAAANQRGRLDGSKWVFDSLGLSLFAHDVARLALSQKGEPTAWQWRKRCHGWTDPDGTKQMVWTEWEALQPPYMDARQLAATDPENYELRPLYL